MSEALLQLHKVNKYFNKTTVNEKHVIKDLDLDIHKGDFITVIGGNGAGKSTLLNTISGALTIESGDITVNNQSIKNLSEEKRAKTISRVFQDPSLGTAQRMTIAENLAIALKRGESRGFKRTLNAKNKQYFKEILKMFDLGLENRLEESVDLLSGGQRQSIALLMATIKEPKLLLLDEHTAALDPKAAAKVMEITDDQIQSSKITTLMITHNMQQAIEYGNRLIMLQNGRIVLDIKGLDKQKLTVNKLVELFRDKGDSNQLTDRILLGD